jgi:hypothetical protein
MRFRKALLAIMLLSMSEAVIAAPKETGTGTLPTELIERLDAPFRQGGNAANAGAPTTTIAPSGPQTRRLPGSVSGNIACNGSEFVGITISIDGEIEAATANSVRKLFDERAQQEKNLKAGIKCAEVFKVPSAFGDGYRINSRGGDVSAAMMIGRIFRQESAFLQVDGVCISACVLVLAGAADRFVKNSFMIGIHRPYLAQTSYTDERAQKLYDDMLKEIRAYLHEMHVSTKLADDMLDTEPEQVHFLSPTELDKYGLASADPAERRRRAVSRELGDLREAKELGLDRVEYTRRKAIVSRVCAVPGVDIEQYDRCKDRILATGKN